MRKTPKIGWQADFGVCLSVREKALLGGQTLAYQCLNLLRCFLLVMAVNPGGQDCRQNGGNNNSGSNLRGCGPDY